MTSEYARSRPFEWVDKFSEGLARVEQNGKYGLINTQGEVVAPCIYDYGTGDFSEGLVRVTQNDKYGFINTKGEVVIPCIYDDARIFSEGLALVEQNGKLSVINTEGKV